MLTNLNPVRDRKSNGINIRPYNNKELLLFPASVGDYLPKDDLVHVVDEAVEEIDLSPYYRKISDVGNPPYHPALMIKIWFYGYATKVYSSRKIEDKTRRDVGFIYLAGMQKPDFKAISEFRRKNLSELRNSFVDILQICHRLGLCKLGEISIDSKVMKANAAAAKSYAEKELTREREKIQKAIQEYLEKTNQTDIEEDKKYGPDKRGNELPEDIRNKDARVKKMKQIAKQLKAAQEKLKQSGKKKINLTDSDSQFQKGHLRKVVPGYRAQAAVDSKQQIIVANDVTDKQSDDSQLIPMVDKTLGNVEKIKPRNNQEKEPIKVITDAGYSSGNNLAELEEKKYKDKIDPYIPDAIYQGKENRHSKDNPFDKNKFEYDKDTNELTCPQGKSLKQIGCEQRNGHKVFIYQCKECKGCPNFGKCTTNRKGRKICISEYEALVDKMRKKLSTKQGKEIYAKRKITVEPVFGNMSHNLGFREFLLRGLEKVKGEFSLMCTAHNLLKIAKFVKQQALTLKEALSMQELLAISNTP